MVLELASIDELVRCFNRELEVPEHDEELVRALGAHFYKGDRTWFMPQGVDPAPFARWHARLRASSYGVLVAKVWCAHCSNLTRVVGLMLPAGYEELQNRGDGTLHWVRNDETIFVPRFIQSLSNEVIVRLRWFNANFKRATEQVWGDLYQNHCEHCAAVHDDRDLHRNVEGVFDPSLIATTAIALHMFEEPFYGRAADGVEFDGVSDPSTSVQSCAISSVSSRRTPR